ncbi:hypothetical protein L2E82_30541 [Cichorium intybus]|uniref:Uncharacterized protein n=1 Tax=Cichorium intybus TaxID=13427 RepID=A0ACB9D0J7_CICIN|nr:hypothetical protein L2E82_30541 [Cichorium intybus]
METVDRDEWRLCKSVVCYNTLSDLAGSVVARGERQPKDGGASIDVDERRQDHFNKTNSDRRLHGGGTEDVRINKGGTEVCMDLMHTEGDMQM